MWRYGTKIKKLEWQRFTEFLKDSFYNAVYNDTNQKQRTLSITWRWQIITMINLKCQTWKIEWLKRLEKQKWGGMWQYRASSVTNGNNCWGVYQNGALLDNHRIITNHLPIAFIKKANILLKCILWPAERRNCQCQVQDIWNTLSGRLSANLKTHVH